MEFFYSQILSTDDKIAAIVTIPSLDLAECRNIWGNLVFCLLKLTEQRWPKLFVLGCVNTDARNPGKDKLTRNPPLPQNGGKYLFSYQGGYWEAKEKQQWDKCPDIY